MFEDVEVGLGVNLAASSNKGCEVAASAFASGLRVVYHIPVHRTMIDPYSVASKAYS